MFKVKTMATICALKRSLFTRQMLDIVLILAIGTLSLTWFRGDFLVSQGDFLFVPSRLRSFFRTFYVWDDVTGLGMSNMRITAGVIPYEFFRASTEVFGVSLTTAEKAWFYLTFTLSGLSMYLLTSTVVTGRGRRLASLFSALFFMMNEYALLFVIVPANGFLLIYSFLPLILALYIRGVKKRGAFRDSFLLNLALLLTTTSFINPVFAIITWFLIFSFFIFHIITFREWKNITRFTFISFAIWFALNAYWILPNTYGSLEEIGKVSAAYSNIGMQFTDTWKLNSVQLVDALRLTGFWAINSNYRGDPYVYWGTMHSTPLFLIISLLIPLLAFSPILLKRRNPYVLYFALLAVFGVFLVKGPYPPFEEISAWLFDNVPLYPVFFSASYLRFGIYVAFSYSLMIGVGASELYYLIKGSGKMNMEIKLGKGRYLRRLGSMFTIALLAFLLFAVYSWPFWTGDVVYPGGNIIPSARVKIPSYYSEASGSIKTQKDSFNIFSLPTSKFDYATYWWNNGSHGFLGDDPTVWLLSRPVIISAQSGHGLSGYLAELITTNSTRSIAKALALMNVKYVLFHRDSNWKYLEGHPWWISTSPESFQAILNSQQSLLFEESFGELDFYRNEYWRPMHIYATPNITLVDGGLDEMIQFIQEDEFMPGGSLLLLSDQLEAQQISALPPNNSLNTNSTENVSVTYEKIDPTRYSVHVNASKPFYLVFSESFHKDWLAYADGQQVPNEHHYMANGYANSWYIDKKGSFTVTLEFWPQKLFYTGAAISITTFILGTLYISKDKIRTIYKRYIKRSKAQKDQNTTVSEDLRTRQKETL